MNILILSLAYAPYSGVGAARMTSLSEYLINKNNNVTVICYDSKIFGEKEQRRQIPDGVERICIEKILNKKENRKNIQLTVEKALQTKNYDICISSVGPYDTMFFLDKIWTKYNVPYIVDYRDPWLFEKTTIKPKGILKYKLLLHDYLYQPVEKRVIKNAAKIISVTKQCQEDLIVRYGINSSKCKVIYNGYEDVPMGKGEINQDEYIVGIAGKFATYNLNAAENFLNACRNVKNTKPIKVLHIGKKELMLEEKYSDIYFNVGEKSHQETMDELVKANALLVSYAHISGLGTKVFDYIAINKPIIYAGIVPSELSGFIGQFENSYICMSEAEVEDALYGLIDKQPLYLTTKDTDIYSREQQNEIYWALIKEIKSERIYSNE